MPDYIDQYTCPHRLRDLRRLEEGLSRGYRGGIRQRGRKSSAAGLVAVFPGAKKGRAKAGFKAGSGARRTAVWTAVLCLLSAWMALGVTLVGTASAASVETGSTVVTFNVAPAIEVTAWPASDLLLATEAVPGVPVVSAPLAMTVKSNAEWGVRIQSDTPGGVLLEFDTMSQAYVLDGLETGPVEWATEMGGPWTPLSTSAVPILSMQPPTGEDGVTVSFLLRVTPDFDARPLAGTRIYRIVLTYTAGVGY